jgi:hypothetical protein
MITRRGVVLGVGAAAPAAWAAQNWGSDIAILREAYETLHPGLYRYATPAQMDQAFDATKRVFERGPDLARAYPSLARLTARIRCGHPYANFFNQSEAVSAAPFSGRNRVPFHFTWIDDRMIVLNPQGVKGLERGDAVTHVNNRPTAQILRALLPYVRADGGNDFKRQALLSVSGEDELETFDIFYGLLFGREAAPINLTVRKPDAKTRPQRLSVLPIDLKDRRAQITAPIVSSASPLWSVRFGQRNVAVLDMPNWAVYKTNGIGQVFWTRCLRDLRSANRLR